MEFWIKVQKIKNEYSVAICDKEIIEKKFKEINIASEFYKGKLANEEKIKEELKKATMANLLGNNCIELALKEGFIDKNGIIEIEGIKHALIFKI